MSLKATIKALVLAHHTRLSDNSNGKADIDVSRTLELTDGVDTGEADLIFQDTRSLAGSATENIDLASTLVDSFGQAVVFAKVKAILIIADPANVTNSLEVTRPASNGFALFMAASDGISLAPGAFFLWADGTAGKTVTASTGDLLTLTNSAGTNAVAYKIVIIGTSA